MSVLYERGLIAMHTLVVGYLFVQQSNRLKSIFQKKKNNALFFKLFNASIVSTYLLLIAAAIPVSKWVCSLSYNKSNQGPPPLCRVFYYSQHFKVGHGLA